VGKAGSETSSDVIVVGAGLAGLGAARALTEAGLKPIVLEARDRVGGRTVNQPLGEGKVVELGGQWVGPGQDSVLGLIEELGLTTFPTYGGDRQHLTERDGRLSRYRGTIPRANPVTLAEVGVALARLDRLAAKVDPASPWSAPDAPKWDRITAATWIRRNLRGRGARRMLELAIQAVWAAEPEEVSMLHLLFYISSAGSTSALLDTEGGAQESRVEGGTQLISIRMAEALTDPVRLDTPVRAVTWLEGEEGGVVVKTESGEFRGRRLIVAIPPVLAGRLVYEPALPALRDGLTQRMIQGNVVKTVSVYRRPFWRDLGLSGRATSADGPLSVIYDNSPPDGSPGVLLAFFEGAAARRVADLATGERRKIVSDGLTRLFGAQASDSIAYFDKAWAADEYSRGCYGGFMPPGAWTSHGRALRAPVGPIHWAGAETATRWAGYMDGAITSGRRAAAEVIEAIGAVG
jgi:monoamine oxidase